MGSILCSCSDPAPIESMSAATNVVYLEDLPTPAQEAFKNALNESATETASDVESSVIETSDSELFIPEEYYMIIDNIVYYHDIYGTEYEDYDAAVEDYFGVWEVLYEENAMDILCFAFLDMDNDNVAELAILDCGDYYDDIRIIDLYTYYDNEVKHLLSGWYRCRYFLTKDFDIVCEGSSGAVYSSLDYYEYDIGLHEFVFVESYFTYPLSENWEDGIGVYHTTEQNYYNENGLDYSKLEEIGVYTDSFDLYDTYEQYEPYDYGDVTTLTEYCDSKEG